MKCFLFCKDPKEKERERGKKKKVDEPPYMQGEPHKDKMQDGLLCS